jgi:hypothetical protein
MVCETNTSYTNCKGWRRENAESERNEIKASASLIISQDPSRRGRERIDPACSAREPGKEQRRRSSSSSVGEQKHALAGKEWW